jgi:GNAT superfamily N-acetyltransferase
MNSKIIKATESDGKALAEIRAAAMEPSLLAAGRFDENRVRSRFLESFEPENTYKILVKGELMGFYALLKKEDHYDLSHLYIKPQFQNSGLGRGVIHNIFGLAKSEGLPVRLGALKGSRSNDFYLKNGFIKTHEDEFDIYYEYAIDTQHEVEFVPYSEQYLKALVKLWRDSFEEAVGIVDPNPIDEQRKYFIDEVLPKNQVLVALDRLKVVGFIAATSDSIDEIYVHTEYQGKGIGSKLLTWAQEHSEGRLELYTFDRNKKSQQFYEHKGFKVLERNKADAWMLDDIKYEWVRA